MEVFDTADKTDKTILKQDLNDLEKILSTYKLNPGSKTKIGFSKVASQIHRAAITKGFQLNLMVVGRSGLGKSTFLNNLFQTKFPRDKSSRRSVESDSVMDCSSFMLLENNVKLGLTVIRIPDFGVQIDNSNCWRGIDSYLNRCFQRQMYEEQNFSRSTENTSKDSLVHLCLFFVQPRGEDRCLMDLDLEFLKMAHSKVNIVPLIAKADTMTTDEIRIHKTNLINELESHCITYFKFTVPNDSKWKPDLPTLKYPNRKYIQTLIEKFPFAVAAGNETVSLEDKQVTVRSYPWGCVQIDKADHCDTSAARTLLLSTHLQELIVHTHTTVYENYRSLLLETMCYKLSIHAENKFQPVFYLDNYFRKVHYALGKKVKEMDNGFEELSTKKLESLHKKRTDIEHESMKMSKELDYLYLKYEKDLAYFVAEKSKWNSDNIEHSEISSTLHIRTPGLIKVFNKFKR